MSYVKQNFEDGMTLKAEHLVNLENAILSLEGSTVSKEQSTSSFIDKVSNYSGYHKYLNSTASTTSSTSYRYCIVPLARYNITHLCCLTGISSSGVIPVLFLSGSTITTSNVVSCEFGETSDYVSHSSFALYDKDITIPDGATHVAFGEFIDISTLLNADTLDEFISNKYLIAYDFNASAADDTESEEEDEPSNIKTYIVRQTDTGSDEYSTLSAALAVASAGDAITIYEGVYEENHLTIPEGLTIKGIGEVVIKGYLPPETSPSTITSWSTFECSYGGNFENITITAQNLRYPIHADFSNGARATWNMKKCKFIHYGNQEAYTYHLENGGNYSNIFSACSAWGGGTYGGDTVYCEDCEFISSGRAFSTHNNTGTSYTTLGPSNVKLVNCILTSYGLDRDGVSTRFPAALFVQSLSCPVDCEVILSNCKVNGYIVYQNSGACWTNQLKMYNCGEFKQVFDTYGSGQSSISDREQNQISTFANDYSGFSYTDSIKQYVNRGSTTIPTGYPVKKSSYNGIEICDNIDDLFGIAMEEIAPQYAGWVQDSGYISRIYLEGVRTSTLVEGDYITITSDGIFESTTEQTPLSIVDNQNIYFNR